MPNRPVNDFDWERKLSDIVIHGIIKKIKSGETLSDSQKKYLKSIGVKRIMGKSINA